MTYYYCIIRTVTLRVHRIMFDLQACTEGITGIL